MRQISDERAMDLIHAVLDGTEWSSDTAPEVADIVKLTGREIGELAEDDGAEPAKTYCHDARHDTPCPLPCDGCEADGCEPDAAGPLTCERCGARVHNLSADGQCITCIAGGDEPEILLCDDCWEAGTGLHAVCQDSCDQSLDHTGECDAYPDAPQECQRCGKRDRLTRITRTDLDFSAAGGAS